MQVDDEIGVVFVDFGGKLIGRIMPLSGKSRIWSTPEALRQGTVPSAVTNRFWHWDIGNEDSLSLARSE